MVVEEQKQVKLNELHAPSGPQVNDVGHRFAWHVRGQSYVYFGTKFITRQGTEQARQDQSRWAGQGK